MSKETFKMPQTTAAKFNELRDVIRCHEKYFDGSYALDLIDDLERARRPEDAR